MARPGITDLPSPARKYRVDRHSRCSNGKRAFETVKKAREEDRLRAAQLRRTARSHFRHVDTRKALALADRIDPNLRGKKIKRSLAAMRYMRPRRIGFFGAVWRLIDKGYCRNTAICCLIPSGLAYAPETLNRADAKKLMAKLRSDLNRAGAKDANGWGVFALHGEFEPESGIYQLHYHGIVTDGMIEVVDRLRGKPKYRRKADKAAGAYHPIWRTDKRLTNIPYAITYVLKPYWPQRRIGPVDGDTKSHRARKAQRIDEPFHSQVLLWLDRWRLGDITLLMKVSATGRGLKISKPKKLRKRG